MRTRISEKEILEKNKIYMKRQTAKLKRNVVIGAVLVMYAFLLASSFILPTTISSASSTTQRGKEIPFADNRTATLVSAEYDEEQEIMELVINFQNGNYDGIDDYYYAIELAGAKTKGTEITEVFNDNLITVVRISGVPAGYAEMVFYFAPQYADLSQVTDEMTGEIVLNRRNVENAAVDLKKTKSAYLADRLDNIIKTYEKRLEGQKKRLETCEKIIAALKQENEDLEKSKTYMTEKEIAAAHENILQNENEMIEQQTAADRYKAKIAATEKDIEEAKAKRENIKR